MEIKQTKALEWAHRHILKRRSPRHTCRGADGKEHYDISYALSYGAQYTVVWSGRSNGKTYSTLQYILRDIAAHGGCAVWLRREREDFRRGRAEGLFGGVKRDGLITDLWPEWEDVRYSAQKSAWYLTRTYTDNRGKLHNELSAQPLMYAAALSEFMHDKGNDVYTGCRWIVLDEFIAPYYLRSEWLFFKNCVSTVARDKQDIRIIMLGNTISPYNPYFREMGIESAKHFKPGTLALYEYAGTDLKVLCEYADMTEVSVRSDLYAFDGAQGRASMISDGVWEVADYPRLPHRERGEREKLLQRIYYCIGSDSYAIDYLKRGKYYVCNVHPNDLPEKGTGDWDKSVIFGIWESDLNPRHFREIPITGQSPAIRKIVTLLLKYTQNGQIFYSDNTTGESFRTWLADNRRALRTGEGA